MSGPSVVLSTAYSLVTRRHTSMACAEWEGRCGRGGPLGAMGGAGPCVRVAGAGNAGAHPAACYDRSGVKGRSSHPICAYDCCATLCDGEQLPDSYSEAVLLVFLARWLRALYTIYPGAPFHWYLEQILTYDPRHILSHSLCTPAWSTRCSGAGRLGRDDSPPTFFAAQHNPCPT